MLERSSQVSLLRPAKLELSSSPILLWLKKGRKGGNNKPFVRVQNRNDNDVVPVIINRRLRLINRGLTYWTIIRKVDHTICAGTDSTLRSAFC